MTEEAQGHPLHDIVAVAHARDLVRWCANLPGQNRRIKLEDTALNLFFILIKLFVLVLTELANFRAKTFFQFVGNAVPLACEVDNGFYEDAYTSDAQGETDPSGRDGSDRPEEDLTLTEKSGIDGMGDGMYAAKVLADIDETHALTEQSAHVIVLVNVKGPGVEGGEDFGVVGDERVHSAAARVVCCSETLG